MKDIKSVLIPIVRLMDKRFKRLASKKKRNYKYYNENISIIEKMIPIHISIETEISNFDNETQSYIERIRTLGSAVGLSIVYTETDIK